MKIYLILSSIILMLTSCASSLPDMTSLDRAQSNIKFNGLLKKEYQEFFSSNFMKNNNTVYAGPDFLKFNNYQPIKITYFASTSASTSIYRQADGTMHEYTYYQQYPTYRGDLAKNQKRFIIKFDAIFKSMFQEEKIPLNFVVTTSCRPELKCYMDHELDYFLHEDPYTFSFELEEKDMILSDPIDLLEFSDTEITAIGQRMIYIGMRKKAAELAIGKDRFIYSPMGFRKVILKDDIIVNFDFETAYEVPFFNNK